MSRHCDPAETVWDACRRRNHCRTGLGGVLVKRPFGAVEPIAWSLWDVNTRLVLGFEDGSRDLAEACELRSKWKVCCCRPSRRRKPVPPAMSPGESRR